MATKKPNYLMWGILLVGGYLLYEESKKNAAAVTPALPMLPQGNGTALPYTGPIPVTPGLPVSTIATTSNTLAVDNTGPTTAYNPITPAPSDTNNGNAISRALFAAIHK
jgi:hypothetical protein